jgi:hypothetical protein
MKKMRVDAKRWMCDTRTSVEIGSGVWLRNLRQVAVATQNWEMGLLPSWHPPVLAQNRHEAFTIRAFLDA